MTIIQHQTSVFNIHHLDKVAVFIDGANLFASTKALGFDIDYKKLLELFREECRLIRILYYTAVEKTSEERPIIKLIDWLNYNGYTMVTKDAKVFKNGEGETKIKGNMDIEIAVDMLELSNSVDHIVLFSGDGDFRRLIEACQRNGKRITVISTTQCSPPMIASELRKQADQYIDLADIKQAIQKIRD